MTTSRPLMQLGIGDLEEIFEKQRTNLVTLSRLKHELSHRQVPKAVALLEKVTAAEAELDDLAVSTPVRPTLQLKPKDAATLKVSDKPQAQPDLLSGLADMPPIAEPLSKPTAPAVAQVPKSAHPPDTVPLPQLALEDAIRILKVGAGDPWEKIEAARRLVVLKSSPVATEGLTAVKVQKLLSDAKLANDAALVIAARRCGRQ